MVIIIFYVDIVSNSLFQQYAQPERNDNISLDVCNFFRHKNITTFMLQPFQQ